MFEFVGIPYSHLLCILKQERVFKLLEEYILRRWSIQARKGFDCYMSIFELTVSFDDSLVARHGDLFYYASMAVDKTEGTRDKNRGKSCDKKGDNFVKQSNILSQCILAQKDVQKELNLPKKKHKRRPDFAEDVRSEVFRMTNATVLLF